MPGCQILDKYGGDRLPDIPVDPKVLADPAKIQE